MEKLVMSFVKSWATQQGSNKLRAFAATPEPDITFKWLAWRYGIWVGEGEGSPQWGSKRLGDLKVTLNGDVFTFWYKRL